VVASVEGGTPGDAAACVDEPGELALTPQFRGVLRERLVVRGGVEVEADEGGDEPVMQPTQGDADPAPVVSVAISLARSMMGSQERLALTGKQRPCCTCHNSVTLARSRM